MYLKIGFSSAILKAALANVGDPRLVMPDDPFLVVLLVQAINPPQKKTHRPIWETHDWSVTVQGEPRSGWLPPLPSVGSAMFWVLCWGWGLSLFPGGGDKDDVKVHHLSLLSSICAVMHWRSTQSSPLPVTTIATAVPLT